MKKITLERLLYRKYLKTSFISILFIGLFLISFYFIVNKNVVNKSKELLLNNLETFVALMVNNQTKIKTEQFLEYLSSKTFPYDGKILIFDEKGKIEFVDEEIKKLLKINEQDNILKNSNYKINYYFKDIIDEKRIDKIVLENKNYLLFPKKISNSSFYLVCIVDEKNILKEINTLIEYCKNLEYVLITGILIFYLLSFFYISFNAKNFVYKINKPLSKIVAFTKVYGKKDTPLELEPCGIFEIDSLSSNFKKMLEELDDRTKKLIIEETKRAYHESLANTDALTGVYNRRYLYTFSEQYLKIVKRENKNLALLILDLDDFKKINDTFGHEIGDLVIKQLVEIAKNCIRENDLIVRFGGDEFIILLPNTQIEQAKTVALKIIDKINEYNKDKEFNFTISVGVSSYQKGDETIDNLISRADDALYQAKKLGKNCIV
ncbi:MAG: diguanylate cyclase [Arcobacter sp.]|uniref:GGDEF domain-containing protein n=1 Tax=Arcobacter sp. TaxID=1872629 RepID=UPI003CFDF4FE